MGIFWLVAGLLLLLLLYFLVLFVLVGGCSPILLSMHSLTVMVAAAVLSCSVCSGRWLQPHFAVRASFDCHRWFCRVTQPFRCTPLWPAAWLLAVDKGRSSKSVEVQRVWENVMTVYGSWLRLMMLDLLGLLMREMFRQPWLFGRLLLSPPWLMLTALLVAVLGGGLVLGRGTAGFRVFFGLVALTVRKVRGDIVDPVDGRDVHMYRDSSIAPLLDLRRRLKVVGDVLGETVLSGFSLSLSLELTAQGIACLRLVLCILSLLKIWFVYRVVAWVAFTRLFVVFMAGCRILFQGLLSCVGRG